MSLYKDRLNFLDALLGLLTEPGETVPQLLEEERPRYGTSLILCFILTIFVPIFVQQVRYGMTVYNTDAVFSLALCLTFTFLIFLLLETVFLNILGVPCSVDESLAIAAYCLAPIMLAIWLVYIFNYWSRGSLSIIALFFTGISDSNDTFISVLPWVYWITQIWVILIFFYGTRALGELSSFSAFIITIFSLVPFYLALIAGLKIAELARPGTMELFLKILASPSAITTFHAH